MFSEYYRPVPKITFPQHFNNTVKQTIITADAFRTLQERSER